MADEKLSCLGQQVIGRVENVGLVDAGLIYKSRIDTGAGVTSLHVEKLTIEKAEKKGEKDYVSFVLKDKRGKVKTLRRPIYEWARIKGKGEEEYYKRPVVKMRICIGDTIIRGRVNLADRGRFLYDLLVGRNMLKGGKFMVDPRRKFTAKPSCADFDE